MAIVRVRRSTGFRDSLRKYRILVDGHEVARVKRGEAADVTVTPGPHVLQMAIDWKRSAIFELSGDGESIVAFRCGSREPQTLSIRLAGFSAIVDIFKRGEDTWLFLERDTGPTRGRSSRNSPIGASSYSLDGIWALRPSALIAEGLASADDPRRCRGGGLHCGRCGCDCIWVWGTRLSERIHPLADSFHIAGAGPQPSNRGVVPTALQAPHRRRGHRSRSATASEVDGPSLGRVRRRVRSGWRARLGLTRAHTTLTVPGSPDYRGRPSRRRITLLHLGASQTPVQGRLLRPWTHRFVDTTPLTLRIDRRDT
jgi:hypothetical protein